MITLQTNKCLMVAFVTLTAPLAQAEVKPAQLFTDHMVIQREAQAAVWGWADPDEKVTVSGSWGRQASAVADAKGKWHVTLQTPPAGGPHTLTLKGKNTVEIHNVMSGDVWLCSGQSNMAMMVQKCANAEEEIAAGDYPLVREFKIRIHPTMTVANDVEADWQACSPETVGRFSGTAYYTARELHKELQVPIGIITAAGGGTLIESWMDAAYLKDDHWAQHEIEIREKKAVGYSEEKAIAEHRRKLEAWKIAAAKAKAENKPLPRRPGRELDPHKDKNYPGNLYRGMIAPIVGYGVKGVIWYQGESNAFMPGRAEYYDVQLRRLIENWRRDWQSDELPFYFVQLPNFKQPQTEPNIEYSGWPLCRESFLQVRLSTPNTGMAVTIDIGEADDIHPKNKQDIGWRLASTILNMTYGKGTPTSPVYVRHEIEGNKVVLFFDYTGSGLMAKGNKLESFAIASSDKKFVWANAVIETRGGKDVVVVSSPDVKTPASVRYGWALNPSRANLYSKEGFPASPFRTDSFDLVNTESEE
ncbi:MAG: sialate O-acetylesterase [Planctomycetes bacterium]|nr:sialate O-acetylesterase [Planctomycetota bacterium]MBL7037101.1 sialate O-acetylesterase [Pirellulaceae bacterium]